MTHNEDNCMKSSSNNSSSSNTVESKEPINELMPAAIVNTIHSGYKPLQELIYEFSFDSSPEWLKQPATLHTFFSIPSSQKQILALAEHAGPLEQMEAYIRKAHARREPYLPATLMQATKRAIIGLDQTIRDDKGVEIDKGMAERLLELHAELLPDTFEEALAQARLAAPLEDKSAKEEREKTNVAAVAAVFDAIKRNDENTTEAIKNFMTLVRTSKPAVMTDNRYHLNLLHFVFAAFDVLVRRGGELADGHYGELADRFCFEIIGAVQTELPARVRQLLRCGLYYILNKIRIAERSLDIDGSAYLFPTVAGLGVDSYYGGWGFAEGGAPSGWGCLRLITSNYYSLQNLLYSGHPLIRSAGV